jgi:murein DD-endopeptidase MepM/ murein hydrolase activator NlpD
MATIGSVFAAKGLWKWWEQNGGRGTNVFNGVTEKGTDFASAVGTPVGAPIGGKVIRVVHNTSSVNDVVELQASDGSVWLYQHIHARVGVGSVLAVGDVVGTQYGLPIDQYSTGSHIEVRYCPPGLWRAGIDSFLEPWINPFPVFSGLSNQVAGATSGGTPVTPPTREPPPPSGFLQTIVGLPAVLGAVALVPLVVALVLVLAIGGGIYVLLHS